MINLKLKRIFILILQGTNVLPIAILITKPVLNQILVSNVYPLAFLMNTLINIKHVSDALQLIYNALDATPLLVLNAQ